LAGTIDTTRFSGQGDIGLPSNEVDAMSIILSQEQQQAIDESPEHLLRLTDPRTSVAYVLMPADEYESVRDVLEDERQQRSVRRAAARNAVARAGEQP
jgi:hypothetical protein